MDRSGADGRRISSGVVDDKRREPTAREDQLAHAVIGAAIEVHRILGPGLLESVYEEAMCVELGLRGVPFRRQYNVAISYKDHPVGGGKVDLFVDDALLVELKAVERLAEIHTAQAISYLRMTRRHLALLINFNVPVLKDGVKRVICS